jgi:hypothetical protein
MEKYLIHSLMYLVVGDLYQKRQFAYLPQGRMKPHLVRSALKVYLGQPKLEHEKR